MEGLFRTVTLVTKLFYNALNWHGGKLSQQVCKSLWNEECDYSDAGLQGAHYASVKGKEHWL